MFLISRLNLNTSSKSKNKIKNKIKNKRKKKKIAILNLKQELTKTNAIKTLNKKGFLILAEKKRLKARMSNYFSHVKRAKDFKQIFKYFIPTLMDFSRSFEPQLLADILAKVILKTKKQTKMLNNIKRLLQAIQLPKNIGYKIVLTGRINSKKKSRLIYITRKQITLQVFDNNMNYAYSQANARIGAFGVKI